MHVPRIIAETAVVALSLPSAFGRVGKRGKPSKADEIYEDFVSKYQDDNIYPTDLVKSGRYTDKMQYRQDRLKGIKRNYQLRVVPFTQARKQNPTKDPFEQDKAAERIIQKISRNY
ncbi:MAG: hypothetical protein ACKPKO_01985, partial [Candidatus Fonsibacter sp.]